MPSGGFTSSVPPRPSLDERRREEHEYTAQLDALPGVTVWRRGAPSPGDFGTPPTTVAEFLDRICVVMEARFGRMRVQDAEAKRLPRTPSGDLPIAMYGHDPGDELGQIWLNTDLDWQLDAALTALRRGRQATDLDISRHREVLYAVIHELFHARRELDAPGEVDWFLLDRGFAQFTEGTVQAATARYADELIGAIGVPWWPGRSRSVPRGEMYYPGPRGLVEGLVARVAGQAWPDPLAPEFDRALTHLVRRGAKSAALADLAGTLAGVRPDHPSLLRHLHESAETITGAAEVSGRLALTMLGRSLGVEAAHNVSRGILSGGGGPSGTAPPPSRSAKAIAAAASGWRPMSPSPAVHLPGE